MELTNLANRLAPWIFLFSFFLSSLEAAPFINCNASVPVKMDFTFADPMVITVGKPFHVLGSALVKEAFPERFKIKHKMQRKLFGIWWTIPCVGEHDFDQSKPFYSLDNVEEKPCYHEMPCEEFLYMGFNGTCPIQPGNYQNYNLTIPVPYFPVPWWLTSGWYRAYIEAYDMNLEKMWFCGSLTQYFEQSHGDQKKILSEIDV